MNVKTHVCKLRKQDGTFMKVNLEDIEKKNFLILSELPDRFVEIFDKELKKIVEWETFKNFLLSKINWFKLKEVSEEDQLILILSGQYDFFNLGEKRLNLDNGLTIEAKLVKSGNDEVFINFDLLKGSRISKSWNERIRLQEVKEDEEYELCFLPSKGKDVDEGYSKIQEISNLNIFRVPDERMDKEFKGLEDTKGIEIDEEKPVDQVDGEKQDSQAKMIKDQLEIQIEERRTELENLNLKIGLGNVETSQEKKQEEEFEIRVEEDSINYDQSIPKLTEFVEVLSSFLSSLQDNLQDNTRILQDNIRKIDDFSQMSSQFLLLYRKRQGWFSTLIFFAGSILTFLVYCFMFATIMFFYFPEIIDPWLAKLNIKFKLLGWKVRWPRVKRGWIRNGRIIVWFERN